MILVFGSNAYAHFFSHEGGLLKWENNYYSSQRGVRVVDVNYNGDYLNVNWGNVLNTAASNWNNNSDQRTIFASTYYNAAPLKLATWQTWPDWAGSSAVAITIWQDTNNNYYFNLDTGVHDPAFSGSIIHGSHIYTNPAFSSNSSFSSSLKTLVLGHEFGHVIGLAHPSSGTTSIMTQSQTQWSTPQAHDRSDLATLYPN
jgi:hypothetical protein